MKVVKDVKTNTVIFAEDELSWVNGKLVGSGFSAPFCNQVDHVIETIENIPDDWQGGHYFYTSAGGWVRTDLGNQVVSISVLALQKQKATEINTKREQTIQSGMSYKFPDGIEGIVDIKSDRDIINITGLGVAALALQLKGDATTKVEYRDEANINHEMTATEMIEFGLAFVQWYSQKYKESWAKKDDLQKDK